MEDGSVHESEQSSEAVPDSTPSSTPEIPPPVEPDSDFFEVIPAEPAAGPTDPAAGLTEQLRGLSEALERSAGQVPAPVEPPAGSFADVVARAMANVEGAGRTAAEAPPAEAAPDSEVAPETEEQGAADQGGIAASLDDIAPGTIAVDEEVEAEDAAVSAETVKSDETAGTDADSAGDVTTGSERETATVGEGTEAGEAAATAEEAEPAETAAAVEGAEPAEPAEPAEQPTAELGITAPRTRVWSWPFVGYVLLWLGGAGYLVWQFEKLPAGQAVYETKLYSLSMLVGLGLLAFGPLLTLVIWIAQWIASRRSVRVGSIFLSALVKGASVTLFGAVIWIAALLLTDYLRFGKLF